MRSTSCTPFHHTLHSGFPDGYGADLLPGLAPSLTAPNHLHDDHDDDGRVSHLAS